MKKGEIKTAVMYINAEELGYAMGSVGAVQAFISAAMLHVKRNAATYLTSFFGSPVLGVATFVATYLSAAFSALATKLNKKGIKVTFTVTCVEKVKTQAGQKFTYLRWKLTDMDVAWY